VTPAALAATVDAVGLNEPGCEDAAAAAGTAGELPLVSSSSTRFFEQFYAIEEPALAFRQWSGRLNFGGIALCRSGFCGWIARIFIIGQQAIRNDAGT